MKGARNLNQKDRKAFETDAFGKMWQADTKYLPYITENGTSRRVYCIGIMDDYSRLELKSQLFYEDNAANFQKVLRDSIAAFGLPSVLYVDNGSPYANEQLALICGELGFTLLHTPVRDGAAKGKRERGWRTLDTKLLFNIDPTEIHSLAQFNEVYREYVLQYNARVNKSTGEAPIERYEKTKDKIRHMQSEEGLDKCFLNRVIRKVHNDATITIHKRLYDVPPELIRQRVEVCYTAYDLSAAYILYNGKQYPIRPTNKVENAKTKRRNIPLDYAKIGDDTDGR